MKNIVIFIFILLTQTTQAQTTAAASEKKDTLAKHIIDRSEIYARGILNIPIPEFGVRYHFTPRFRALASYTYHDINTNIQFLGTSVVGYDRYHIAKIGGEYTFSRKPFHGFVHLDAYYASGEFSTHTRFFGPKGPTSDAFDKQVGTQSGVGVGVGLGLEYVIQNRVYIGIMPYISFLSRATRSFQHNALEYHTEANIRKDIDEYMQNQQTVFFFFYPVTLSVGCRL